MSKKQQPVATWDLELLQIDDIEDQLVLLKSRIEKIKTVFKNEDDLNTVELFTALVHAVNPALELSKDLLVCATLLLRADSRNQSAAMSRQRIQIVSSEIPVLIETIDEWCQSHYAELIKSDIGKKYKFLLDQGAVSSKHRLNSKENRFFAKLRPYLNWSQIYTQVITTLEVDSPAGGNISITQGSHISASHPDRSVRQAMHARNMNAYDGVKNIIFPSLYSGKSIEHTIAIEKKWGSTLEENLFQNRIQPSTLDIVIETCRKATKMMHSFFEIRKRELDVDKLGWFDLKIQLAQSENWEWSDVTSFLQEAFRDYSPEMTDLFNETISSRLIDAEMRPRKLNGAACTPVRGMSFIGIQPSGTVSDVTTLGHEMGHSYHYNLLMDAPSLYRNAPLVLQEVPSMFFQQFVTKNLTNRYEVLEAELLGFTSLNFSLTDFLVEQEFMRMIASKKGVSSEKLVELTLDIEMEVFGDRVFDRSLMNGYRWVYIPHINKATYYNYQYIFGALFSLGLQSLQENNSKKFVEQFDDFLTNSGNGYVESLAQNSFGINLTSSEFWDDCLVVLEGKIDDFSKLTQSKNS